MQIAIPRKLYTILQKDIFWLTNVNRLMLNIEGLFLNGPEFFPDYTIHGIDHINEVLDHTCALISAKSFKYLTARDIAFLVSAIIIHDLGMFLRLDGTRKMIQRNHWDTSMDYFGDKSWEKTWIDYIDQTKRYPEEKMHYHFGKNITVSESCVNKDNLTDYDKRVIGEFLRQNHPRIAYEIAVGIMPASDDFDVFEGTQFEREDRQMIGLLARSHGMAIRDTERFVLNVFGSDMYNTPVYYLMAILRIADFLDAGKHRAPVIREKHQKIHVPISAKEWSWNQRINRHNCSWDPDRQKRYIYATPTTSVEYIHLDQWLTNLQAELDSAWALMAENHPPKYQLSIHRIDCNIYEPGIREHLNKKFLTKEVKVSTNPEITRLMVSPLYGNDPSYGVRELIQNAVDACVERKFKGKDKDYHGLVTVRIDTFPNPEPGEPAGVFTIEDNGIGMNEYVLMHYYLCAGASYRSSDAWQAAYAADKRSQVARTGKFGIGFLSTFLLGETACVTTQHIADSQGYSFEFSNQAKPLNVTRVARSTGTTIRIDLDSETVKKLEMCNALSWSDWYAFDEPEVQYYYNGVRRWHKGISLSRNLDNNQDWFALDSTTYQEYLWRPVELEANASDLPEFYCNGIRIRGGNMNSLADYGLNVSAPHVSIIDRDAKLEIDLARSRILVFPEENQLIQQVLQYQIARLLTTTWETEDDWRNHMIFGFPLRPADRDGRISFLMSPGGFTLNCLSMLTPMKINQYLILYSRSISPNRLLDEVYQFVPHSVPVMLMPEDSNSVPVFEGDEIYRFRNPGFFADAVLSASIPVYFRSNTRYDILGNMEDAWMTRQAFLSTDTDRLFCRVRVVRMDSPFVILENRRKGSDSPAMPLSESDFDSGRFPVAIHIGLNREAVCNTDTLFTRMLRETLIPAEGYSRDDLWIPYRMEDRKAKFPSAYKKLERYIDLIKRTQAREAQKSAMRSQENSKEGKKTQIDEIYRKFKEVVANIPSQELRRKYMETYEKSVKPDGDPMDKVSNYWDCLEDESMKNLLRLCLSESQIQRLLTFLYRLD